VKIKVAYGDTDSVMPKFPDDLSLEETKFASYCLCSLLNDDLLPRLAKEIGATENLFQLKVEAVATAAVFKKKKHYVMALGYKDGTVKDPPILYMKGVAPRRSDATDFTKGVLNKLFKKVLIDEDLTGLERILAQAYFRFMRASIYSISIPTGIHTEITKEKKWVEYAEPRFSKKHGTMVKGHFTSQSATVRAAAHANEYMGKEIKTDDKVRYVYMLEEKWRKSKKELRASNGNVIAPYDVIGFEFPEDVQKHWRRFVDWEKMREKALVKKTEEFLDMIELPWKKIKSARNAQVNKAPGTLFAYT
jgi:DNA polymerase elongation subunit (family B)